MEMINMIDCPMVIEESRDKNGNLPDDFNSYCGKFDDNLYFQKSCDNGYKQCLDKFIQNILNIYIILRLAKNYNILFKNGKKTINQHLANMMKVFILKKKNINPHPKKKLITLIKFP